MKPELIDDETSKALFMDGANSVFAEKRAGLKDFWNALKSFASAGVSAGGLGLSALKDVGLMGIAAGGLGSAAYNIVKDNITEQDPKDEFNRKVESIIANRQRELSDSRWMTRVRNMRNELIVSGKRMDPEVYAQKYKALVDALDERRA